jgi:hypothetical protein
MAKQTQNSNVENVNEVNDKLHEVVTQGGDYTDLFDKLEKADDTAFMEITSEYFTPEENKTYNFVATKISTANLDGKDVEVVELLDREGKRFINGNAVLVNSVKKLTTFPSLVRIITAGKKKSANGQYLDMQVKVVPNATK